jgi:hypothetical protein
LTFGAVALGIAIVAAIVLFAAGIERGWRAVLFVPLWLAALGFFQARDKTWVKLAARGLRDMDQGAAPITEPGELAQVRRQARSVHVKSLVSAALVTAILVVV